MERLNRERTTAVEVSRKAKTQSLTGAVTLIVSRVKNSAVRYCSQQNFGRRLIVSRVSVSEIEKLNSRNNAQVMNQVVVYVLAALIFILILGYGYKAINSFIEKGRVVQFDVFKSSLETEVESIRRDYLSERTAELSLPPDFTTLCVVDSVESGLLQTSHPLLFGSWLTGSENVFLLPVHKQLAPLKLPNIEVYDAQKRRGYFCLDQVRGIISLQLQGLGDRVKITPFANS